MLLCLGRRDSAQHSLWAKPASSPLPILFLARAVLGRAPAVPWSQTCEHDHLGQGACGQGADQGQGAGPPPKLGDGRNPGSQEFPGEAAITSQICGAKSPKKGSEQQIQEKKDARR